MDGLKNKTLSEELNSWWQGQTIFKTKKELAESLKVHPDTVRTYFSGRKFPKEDIERRLWEITNIACLEPGAESSLPMAPPPSQSSTTEAEPNAESLPDSDNNNRSENVPEIVKAKMKRQALETRYRHSERSMVISIQRTFCPICGHTVRAFHTCSHCGQLFVWANVPLKPDDLSEGSLDNQ